MWTKIELEDWMSVGRLVTVVVAPLLAPQQCSMRDMTEQTLDLPVIGQTERLQPALPAEPRRDLVEGRQAIVPLGLDQVMFEPAAWFAVAVAVAAAAAAVVVAAAVAELVAED